MEDLLKFKETLTQEGVLISFNGSFSNSIIEEIGRAIRTYLQKEKLSGGIISDVFSIYIEQTQNIRNYIELNGMANTPAGEAMVTIAKKRLLHHQFREQCQKERCAKIGGLFGKIKQFG